MNELHEKMASQERIKELRDDPLGAGRATRFDTSVRRMQRFDKNIGIVRGELAETEGYLRESVDVLHRINELAVQGANGPQGTGCVGANDPQATCGSGFCGKCIL